ncbi:hypothetical protein [Sinomicrobium sp.]
MSLLKRIGFYLIGLSIGLVVVTFFLREKGTSFCYGPNCRVLKNIRSKQITFQEEVQRAFVANAIDTTGITQAVFTDGEVNFSESDTKRDSCKTYVIEAVLNSKEISISVENCDSIAKIYDFKLRQ